MRISKLLSAVCAAAFLAGFLTVRAQDNPAQAAARAALMGKMGEPNAQPSPPTNQMMAPAIAVTPSGTAVAQPSPPANQTTATATPPETPPAPASANDTPAQAAARAALMDKMGQPDAQQNQPANANLAPIVLAPSNATVEQPGQPANAAPKVKPTSKMTDDNVVMTPINKPVSKAEKTAAAAKAKQEADQAAADLKAKKEADRKAAEQKVADEAAAKAQAKAKARADAQQAAAELKAKKEAEAAAKAQVGAQPAAPLADNSGIFTPVPPPSNPGVQPGIKAVPTGTPPSSYQWQNPPPAKPAAPAVAPAVKPAPANASYAGKTLGFKPVEAPAPPVSAQKQAELQALLARYMANQISPDEYQKERAAILAAP